MEFSKVLRETRKRMDLTQSVMAEKLGISRASLSLYETGKQTPSLEVLDALHNVTGAPLDYLMGYTDNYTVETLGIDKELGLSTETINRLKSDKLVQVAVNHLVESPIFHQWLDAATEYHDTSVISQNLSSIDKTNIEAKQDNPKGGRYGLDFSIKIKMGDLREEIGNLSASIFEGQSKEPLMRNDISIQSIATFGWQVLHNIIATKIDGLSESEITKQVQEIFLSEKEV